MFDDLPVDVTSKSSLSGDSSQLTAEGMLLQLADGTTVACNSSAERILGYTASQIQQWSNTDFPWQMIHEDGSSVSYQTHPAIVALQTGKPCLNVVMGFYQPSGKLVWLRLNSQPLFQANRSSPYAVVTSFYDITQQKLQQSGKHSLVEVTSENLLQHQALLNTAREALRHSEELFRLAINHIPDVFVIYDAQRRFQFVNQAGLTLSGKQPQDLLGRTDDQVFPPEVTASYLPILQRAIETKTEQTGECTITLPDTEPYTIVVQYVPMLNIQGEIQQILGITYDITERKQKELKLQQNALYDSLTGLPNRVLLTENIKYSLQQAQQKNDYLFAVLFLDIDGFKEINDSLGHLQGDQLLVAIASRLSNCIRSVDIAARLGGDEFVILLVGIKNLSDAIQIAERIQQELAHPCKLDGQEVFISASIGIALSSTLDYDLPEDLLRDADMAMYRAKTQGKARYELFTTDLE
ncbi:diguanylate cyclase domain-containing protein [Anabaena sp. CA = ATCC 33047]|nr:diguanylate cyclase [Anabaena sp. CA = ATCC 33047]